MKRILLLAILSQVRSMALDPLCKTINGSSLYCVPIQECPGQWAPSLAQCDDYVRYCCPREIMHRSLQQRIKHESPIPYFPTYCGETPVYEHEHGQEVAGYVTQPDEYSWMASLQYNNTDTFGEAAGSVINQRFVLTAAHCVTGEKLQSKVLTGVRLGNFRREPKCDYGNPECDNYQHFGIAESIVHEKYTESANHENDIALLRLDRNIILGYSVQPICLPFYMKQLPANTQLIFSGWGNSYETMEIKKRSVAVQLWDNTKCKQNDESFDDSKMCAGKIEALNGTNDGVSCDGDTGGPLMYEFLPGRMILVGIVSSSRRPCGNHFFASQYTIVRQFLSWIDSKVRSYGRT